MNVSWIADHQQFNTTKVESYQQDYHSRYPISRRYGTEETPLIVDFSSVDILLASSSALSRIAFHNTRTIDGYEDPANL
ncbi:hypothetical protein Tco_1502964 [Tanacetum coccineum]